jgi:hypothetical protein
MDPKPDGPSSPHSDSDSRPKSPSSRRHSRGRKSANEDAVKNRMNSLPPVTDSEFRLACNDIAEALSKHWGFVWKVVGVTVAIISSLIVVIFTVLGWGVLNYINYKTSQYYSSADLKLKDAQQQISDQIALEFKTAAIQKTIQDTAAAQANILLEQSVRPTIETFNSKVSSASKDLDSLKAQLSELKKYNAMEALADRAIGDGDVDAYRKLDGIASDAKADKSTHVLALVGLFRVYEAYSLFAPSRVLPDLIVSKINPKKHNENELEANELLPLLTMDNALGRAKVASLLVAKAGVGSYKTAQAVAAAIKSETDLEAIRYLNAVYQRVTGFSSQKLDGKDILDDWEKNKSSYQSKDADLLKKP